MDFHACLSSCRATRSKFSPLFSGVPSSLKFSADGEHVLFLSAAGGAGTSLYRVGVEGEEHPWKKLYRLATVWPSRLTLMWAGNDTRLSLLHDNADKHAIA